MKFLRQFAAATAVVAVVVLTGLAWSRLAPSLPGEGPAGRAFAVRGHVVKRLPHGSVRGIVRNNDGSGVPSLLLGDLLEPASLAVLWNNALLEAAVLAAVIILDAGHRRIRRARRQPGRASAAGKY